MIDKIVFNIDYATRKLKHLQKFCPLTEETHYQAIYFYSMMKSNCDLLQINEYDWIKTVSIPWMVKHEGYERLFNPDINNHPYGQPMQRVGYFLPLIKKFSPLEINIDRLA